MVNRINVERSVVCPIVDDAMPPVRACFVDRGREGELVGRAADESVDV
jgi:hypothetical protein